MVKNNENDIHFFINKVKIGRVFLVFGLMMCARKELTFLSYME